MGRESAQSKTDTSIVVSVVIPCFNCAATIAETLDCIFQQSQPGIEIIAVDDGSTDETLSILKSYQPAIRVVTAPNGGASKARNTGTALARGAYIQYLDADDLLAPDAIQTRIHALAMSGAGIAYSGYQYFEMDRSGSRVAGQTIDRDIASVDPDPAVAVATTFWAPPAALLYTRRAVEAAGRWNETLPMIEDARFLFDAITAGETLVRIEGVSAFYRVTPGSLSRSNKPEYVRCVFRNGCDIQRIWQAEGELPPARKKALAWIFRGAAFEFLKLDMPEFTQAMARYQDISGQRRDFLSIAHLCSPFVGRRNTLAILQGAAAARTRLRGPATATQQRA